MRNLFASAVCIVTAAALSMAPPAVAAEPRPSPEARVHFKAGIAALKRERWNEAYREFKEAYAITPRWTILGNLGIAAQRLERDGEAIDCMEQYLERGQGEISRAETAEVREAIDALRAGTAEVTLEVPGPFSIVDTRVAESEIVNEYGPFENRVTLSVRAGQHTFEVKGASAELPAWSVALLAGDAATHAFAVEPEQPSPVDQDSSPAPVAEEYDVEVVRPSYTASYILWGVGAAGAVTAAVLGVRAYALQRDTDRDFEDRCPFGATGVNGCENVTKGSEQAARWRTAALLTGGSAVGLLVTGTVLYLVRDSDTSRTHASEAVLQPWVTPTSIGLVGAF
jgi:hypothetical protein